jgi:hypothetical protein
MANRGKVGDNHTLPLLADYGVLYTIFLIEAARPLATIVTL